MKTQNTLDLLPDDGLGTPNSLEELLNRAPFQGLSEFERMQAKAVLRDFLAQKFSLRETPTEVWEAIFKVA